MKFVTVMDMWLLIMNLGLLGFIIYFGRKVSATLVRIAGVADRTADTPEKNRILKIIRVEIETYSQMASMGDADAQVVFDVLKDIEKQIVNK